jgi:succinate dehydrogenase / fumarate reductase flavoprotein subunit
MDPKWRQINLVCALDGDWGTGGRITLTRQPLPKMRDDQLALFDRSELKKYLTDEELAAIPDTAPAEPTEAH